MLDLEDVGPPLREHGARRGNVGPRCDLEDADTLHRLGRTLVRTAVHPSLHVSWSRAQRSDVWSSAAPPTRCFKLGAKLTWRPEMLRCCGDAPGVRSTGRRLPTQCTDAELDKPLGVGEGSTQLVAKH